MSTARSRILGAGLAAVAVLLVVGTVLTAARPDRRGAGVGTSPSGAAPSSRVVEPSRTGTPSRPEPTPSVQPDQLGLYRQTFTSEEAGFAIDLPEDWLEEPDADPGFVWVHGRGGSLRIRIGDADGYILTCNVPVDSPCQNVHIDSVETLGNILEPARGASGRDWITTDSRSVSLGSSPAVRIIVRNLRSAGQGARYFIAAIEDGRPIIIRWQPERFGGAELQELLASFRLLD